MSLPLSMVNMSVPKSTATNLASTDPVRTTLLHLVAIPATFSCENKSDPDFQRHGQTKRARGRGGDRGIRTRERGAPGRSFTKPNDGPVWPRRSSSWRAAGSILDRFGGGPLGPREEGAPQWRQPSSSSSSTTSRRSSGMLVRFAPSAGPAAAHRRTAAASVTRRHAIVAT